MLQVIGDAFLVTALILMFDVGGAATKVIRYVTSKPLRGLAPGFAATRFGLRIYAALLGTLGLAVIGVAVAQIVPIAGLVVIAAGVVSFVLLSVVAIRGEVRTYRALKR